MDEAKVRQIIREELAGLLASDRITFKKHAQFFDGRNIQLGRTTGTKIGTAADQKLGFFGAAPVAQQNVPLTSPTEQDIIDALLALGLLEQSD